MDDLDPRQRDAILLRHQERFGEALSLLLQLFDEVERECAPSRSQYFPIMVEFHLLVEHYAPARAALAGLREAQAARLLAGDLYCGAGHGAGKEDGGRRADRFSLVAEIGQTLGDTRATYDLFRRLDADQPALARRHAWLALPAVVEAGDFELADRYRRDPLDMLGEVNRSARSMPLFPPSGKAPRVAGELMSLTRDVQLAMAVLRGQGKEAEAVDLRRALLDGLESAEVRALAERELDEPGTIKGELVERSMAGEAG